MASRGSKLFIQLGICFLIWIIVLFQFDGYINTVARSMVTYGLIVYFSNALYKVGRDLSQLKDYPEEEESLKREVQQAHQFYKNKGLQL